MAKRARSATSLLRRRGLRLALWAVVLTVALPALTQAMNAFTLSGFPFGFYLMAQGAPVLLVALAVLFAARADREELRAGSDKPASQLGGAGE